jgi:hypothetical protein
VISDPAVDYAKIIEEQLSKRPGDLPEYLDRLQSAKDRKRQRLFEQSFKACFGSL